MSDFSLTIIPGQSEYLLKPGASLTQAYQITNDSSNTLFLTTEVLPWIPLGNNGDVSFDNVSAPSSINFSLNNSDLKLFQSFSLRPKETRQLVLKVATDQNTPLNDYYYTFFVKQVDNQITTQDNYSQTYGKIGSHLLLSLSNTATPENSSQIRNFQVTPKIKDIFLTPLTFSGEIKNNSNYFFHTNGTLTLTKNNLKIKELKLKDSNVLAHHTRFLNCQDQNVCTISPPFWPGVYTATINLDSSLNAAPISVSFFVFPFSPFALLALVFLILIFFKKFTRKTDQTKSNKDNSS
jgi:hypothetical protein